MVPRAVGFTIVWPEGVIFGSIMTYHVQFLLLVRQPLFDRAALPLTQTSRVLPPLSVGKMTLRLYGALNYSNGLSKGPSFGTGRDIRGIQLSADLIMDFFPWPDAPIVPRADHTLAAKASEVLLKLLT